MLRDLVDLTEGLPERRLEPGEPLYEEGDPGDTSIVLVSGALVVEHGGEVIDHHTAPGSVLGELGALLHRDRNATVRAEGVTVVRELGRPEVVFTEHPEVALEIARQLAARLDRLRAYTLEVRRQYPDHDDHIGMFGELLDRIAQSPATHIEGGGSERDAPDY